MRDAREWAEEIVSKHANAWYPEMEREISEAISQARSEGRCNPLSSALIVNRTEARREAFEEAARIIKERWTFDSYQHHTHSWHDYADALEILLRKAKEGGEQ